MDFQKSPYYQIGVMLQSLASFYILNFITGIDSMSYALLAFCYCQTLMLNEALRSINIDNLTEENDKACYTRLRKCIIHHIRITE